MEEDLNQQNLEEESEDEAPNYGPIPELEAESTAVRLRELEETQHFISVCMKQDERLHAAALKGDVQLLQELTTGRFDVDRDPGAWGTPLVAAIMTCSNEAVTFLLDAGANPLSQVGPMDSPVLAATLFGTAFAPSEVLAKISSRQRKSNLFQEAVDKALFAAIDESRPFQTEQTETLLHAGVNPFFSMADQRTSFSISASRGNAGLRENFLA
jgi:ankyrin repeat protein